MPRCWTCGSANTWSMALIGPDGTPASLNRSTQVGAGRRRRRSPLDLVVQRGAVLGAQRRGRVIGMVRCRSCASMAWQNRSQMVVPVTAMLMWPSAVSKTPVGMLSRMVVAGLLRHLALRSASAPPGNPASRSAPASSEVCTHWPSPGRLALEQRHQDAERAVDAGGQVGDAGCRRASAPAPAGPVIDMRPPMPCAIWSKPGRSR